MRQHVADVEKWDFEVNQFVEADIVYEEDGELYLTCTTERMGIGKYDVTNLPQGNIIQIEPTWPEYDGQLTRFAGNVTNHYVKRSSIWHVAYCKPIEVQERTLAEARMLERVMTSPHLNVVSYHGCLVEDGKIKGLVLDQYRDTLSRRIYDGVAVDKDKIIHDIEQAIAHLHSLDIVHGDISPANIMFDVNNNAVLIDLDSGAMVGTKFEYASKGGTRDFTNNASAAEFDNDWYSLERVKSFCSTNKDSGGNSDTQDYLASGNELKSEELMKEDSKLKDAKAWL